MASPYDSRAIANEILKIAGTQNKPLTIMQLLKLVYLAQGFALALLKRPLVANEVQAWQYGPVYPHVYRAFRHSGPNTITAPAINKETGLPYAAKLEADEREVVEAVVTTYGDMHAFQLSRLMHRDGTPWSTVFKRDGVYKPIPNDLIKAHFENLIDGEKANAADRGVNQGFEGSNPAEPNA